MKLGVDIPKSYMNALEARALRLTSVIDAATSQSPDRLIRDSGAQLSDRIVEWVEEIKELLELGDEEVFERIQSFVTRLHIAERKIQSWPLPKDSQKRIRASRRRRTHTAKAA